MKKKITWKKKQQLLAMSWQSHFKAEKSYFVFRMACGIQSSDFAGREYHDDAKHSSINGKMPTCCLVTSPVRGKHKEKKHYLYSLTQSLRISINA